MHINVKPVDVPVDKLAAPVAITPPPPDANVVPTAPESPKAQKPPKGASKFNKFLKKPGGGRRFLKGFRRGDDKNAANNAPAIIAATPTSASVTFLPDDTSSALKKPMAVPDDETRIKKERHAAQMNEYEERLSDWNAELKRKKIQHEAMDLPFDPDTEMRPKPTRPAHLVEDEQGSASSFSEEPPAHLENGNGNGNNGKLQKRVSSFRPINTPVVPEGQKAKASEIAEMFAAKAYGTPAVHPAATPGHGHCTTSVNHANNVSMASMFSVAGPILPPGASMDNMSAIPPQHSMSMGAHTGMTAPYAQQPSTHTHAYQPAPQAFTPHVPQAQYAPPMGVPQAQMQQVQSNTYIGPALAERIRRGREMTKLGIRSEESGNMGSAKEAYMKALEVLIPTIPMLDHGNDVSYTFRMNEKRKLNREAGLMLDRCEEIKKFLDGEVAALNTRNLLESAPAPRLVPKKPSLVRQEFYPDSSPNDLNVDNNTPVHTPIPPQVPKLNVPMAPPPPSAGLLDGFASITLGDPLSQQAHPRAPIQPLRQTFSQLPAPLPRSTFHRKSNSGSFDETRQQAMSRPPFDTASNDNSHIPLSPPALPNSPPTIHMGTACECCKTSPASFMSKCSHKYCAPCMNKAATFGTCLICCESLASNDFKHIL